MIIRISDDLMRAIFEAEPTIRMSAHPGDFPRVNAALKVLEIVPPWLSEMAQGGAMLVISDEDYEDIPPEVRGFVDVIKR